MSLKDKCICGHCMELVDRGKWKSHVEKAHGIKVYGRYFGMVEFAVRYGFSKAEWDKRGAGGALKACTDKLYSGDRV